jgi:hypothetical protein
MPMTSFDRLCRQIERGTVRAPSSVTELGHFGSLATFVRELMLSDTDLRCGRRLTMILQSNLESAHFG